MIGFKHSEFQPTSRPGLDPDCYNGLNKALHHKATVYKKPEDVIPPFERCPIK